MDLSSKNHIVVPHEMNKELKRLLLLRYHQTEGNRVLTFNEGVLMTALCYNHTIHFNYMGDNRSKSYNIKNILSRYMTVYSASDPTFMIHSTLTVKLSNANDFSVILYMISTVDFMMNELEIYRLMNIELKNMLLREYHRYLMDDITWLPHHIIIISICYNTTLLMKYLQDGIILRRFEMGRILRFTGIDLKQLHNDYRDKAFYNSIMLNSRKRYEELLQTIDGCHNDY